MAWRTGGQRSGSSSWRGVIEKQRASGLSVAEFCRRNDLAEAQFYRWRRKLAELDERIPMGDRAIRSGAAAKFVPIEPPPPSVPAGLEIVRPDAGQIVDAGPICPYRRPAAEADEQFFAPVRSQDPQKKRGTHLDVEA